MQPFSRNQRPDLLTSLMNMSFLLPLPRDMNIFRSSSNVPRLPSFLDVPQNPHALLTFGKLHDPLRVPRRTASERHVVFFSILTSKCASRDKGAHFFSISTSKSCLKLSTFFALLTWKCAWRHNGVNSFHLSSGQLAPHPPL